MDLYLFLVIILLPTCWCIESPEPEVFLQPRNFNPHPYAEGGRAPPAIEGLRRPATAVPGDAVFAGRRGPVLFPPNPGDAVQSTTAGYVGEGLGAYAGDRGHPYAGVARKQKIKLGGRFSVSDQENNINPRVYSGLANYAAKVLKKPVNTATVAQTSNGYHPVHVNVNLPLEHADPSLAAQKKDYAFSYAVRDRATGDDFSHSQSQNSRATNGEYRVKLPDGRVQIVSYTADRNGYNAEVKYADDEEHVIPHQQAVPLTKSIQQRIVVPDYEYYEEPQVTQVELPIYEDYQNPSSNYQQHRQEYVPINSYKSIQHPKIATHGQYIISDKVRLFQIPQNNIQVSSKALHGHHDDKLFTATIVPYADNSISSGYQRNLVSTVAPPRYYSSSASPQFLSTVAPPRFSQVYITTPKYTVNHGDSHTDKLGNAYYKKRK